MNASGELFSTKKTEDMLKLGSIASMGLPKYLFEIIGHWLIDISRRYLS